MLKGKIGSYAFLAIGFVLGGIVTPALDNSVDLLFQRTYEARNEPQAIICAPLQESRLVVRNGDEIVHDVEYGFPNDTMTAFLAGEEMLEDVELLLYPLGHHRRSPEVYYATVHTSDKMASRDTAVEIKGASISISMPFLKAQEIVYIDVLFGQPVTMLLEVRANDFSSKYHGVAGCANTPDHIESPPIELVYEYELSNCGTSGDEVCGIPATSDGGLEFTVGEDGETPTFEEIIIRNDERIYRQPAD